MRLIKPNFEVINETNPLKKIELAGRLCYKSEDKITEKSAIQFAENIIKRGHEAVLEHSNIVLKISIFRYFWLLLLHPVFINFTFEKFRPIISGNVRAFRDLKREYPNNKWIMKLINTLFINSDYMVLFNDLAESKISKPFLYLKNIKLLKESDLLYQNEKLNHIVRTIKFVCDRGVSHEIVRHRPFSYCQESTRYCNYSGNKFGGHITFIIPSWVKIEPGEYEGNALFNTNDRASIFWADACKNNEDYYNQLTDLGWQPQQARSILDNSLKTEIICTATLKRWHHFFVMRTPKTAHPQMRELAIPACKTFQNEFLVIFDDIKIEEETSN